MKNPTLSEGRSTRALLSSAVALLGLLGLPGPAVGPVAAQPSVLGGEFTVNVSTAGEQRVPAAVAVDDGSTLFLWTGPDSSDGGDSVFLRRLDPANLGDAETPIVSPRAGMQSAVGRGAACRRPSGDFVVAWTDSGRSLDDDVLARLAADGAAVGAEIPVATGDGDAAANAAVCCQPSGGFVVAWNGNASDADDLGVSARRFASDGSAGAAFQVNSYTTGAQYLPSLCCRPDGGFVAVWKDLAAVAGAGSLRGRRFDSLGGGVGSEFAVNSLTTGDRGATPGPVVACASDGSFQAVWAGQGTSNSYAVSSRRFDSSGSPDGSEFEIAPLDAAYFGAPSASFADDDRFVVAWADYGDAQGGEGLDVLVRGFDAGGGGLGGALLANDATAGDQGSVGAPAVSFSTRTEFVLAWDGAGSGDPAGIVARRLELAICGDGVVSGAEECDDGNTAGLDCCSPSCTIDADGAACEDGLFCNGSDTCSSGECTAHGGDPCPGGNGDEDCSESCDEASDSCTADDGDGVACDDGVFCNGADTCAAGVCSAHTGDPCVGADGDGDCAESCNEAGADCSAADLDGSACDDGAFCNGDDSCDAGACSVHTGDPCLGADGDGDCAESCDEGADNCAAADLDGSACDDGVFCNGTDTCLAGACASHTGDPCVGADGDGDCAESCDEGAGNCAAADLDGSPCDDGVFCNGTDTCLAGACAAHSGDPCVGADGDGDCAESCDEVGATCSAADADGSACDDGVFCNGSDTCASGLCASHTGDPCVGADGDGDCAESCDEGAGDCLGADSDGSACDDGLFCNGADTCLAGACDDHAGDPCVGADGDGDCAESCDEVADDCTGADADDSACDDGEFCNGPDRCDGGACSLHDGDPCAGADGDGDCAESCDEAGDACTAADADGSVCDDGLFCTAVDECSAGLCEGSDNPCGGGGDCTDTCNEDEGLCRSCGEPLSAERCVVNAVVILNAAVGSATCDLCICDVDGSTVVGAADSLIVLRGCIGLPVALDCPPIPGLP